ncbi:toll/interleukin-1 receptor domain-containing protein [Crocosphaera sp.]|uniref:toll/interleukin-1 receptor domain-containing protein n=1 Tax=Crocosphaera sp. TaxID=2729996 RepID=UPI00262491D6|nr:toll/interleukin-1 receptor domain-containing protein [Crocosphaera sp.]MDJ0581237.1 toll/interleukin-1 receptor domain-containing protein [Crocosphaera sp.]
MTDIFISCSLKDIEWVKRIQEHLAPLLERKNLSLWSYDFIYPGENWQETIEKSIKESQVIIVLISENYLNSSLPEVELSLISKKYHQDSVKIFPVIISSVSQSSVPDLFQMIQAFGSVSKPLSDLSKEGQEKALSELTKIIDDCVSAKPQNIHIKIANMGNITDNVFVNIANNLAKDHEQ